MTTKNIPWFVIETKPFQFRYTSREASNLARRYGAVQFVLRNQSLTKYSLKGIEDLKVEANGIETRMSELGYTINPEKIK